MKRFILYSQLKPEKREEYITLHKNAWPEILKIITECNIKNYSISIRNNELYTYYEYYGDDYDKDMNRMGEYEIMQKWWSFTKPCFLNHDEGKYYDDLEEIFYLE